MPAMLPCLCRFLIGGMAVLLASHAITAGSLHSAFKYLVSHSVAKSHLQVGYIAGPELLWRIDVQPGSKVSVIKELE